MANHTDRIEARREAQAERAGKEFSACHRFARIGPKKVGLVAEAIRGLPVSRALEQLKFSKKRGAKMLDKVVRSALANAEYQISERKLDLDIDGLVVAESYANEGPRLKRWMTRSRGMAYPIWRPMCHIHVTLKARGGEPDDGGETKAAGAGAPVKASSKPGKAAKAAKSGKKKATAGAK